MAARLIKVRLRFERPAEFWGLAISVAAHVLACAVMLGGFSWGTAPPLPGPSMAVTLTGASITARGSARTQAALEPKRSAPRPELPKPLPEKPLAPQKATPVTPAQRTTPSKHTRAIDPRPEPPAASPSSTETDTSAAPQPTADELDLPVGPIAGGVVGLDSISSLSPGYAGSVAQRLQSAWTDRPVLPQGTQAQRAVIRFRILRDGRIEAVELSQESEFTLLNQSVLRLLRSVGRLPAFPPSIKRDSIDAEFVFELLPAEP